MHLVGRRRRLLCALLVLAPLAAQARRAGRTTFWKPIAEQVVHGGKPVVQVVAKSGLLSYGVDLTEGRAYPVVVVEQRRDGVDDFVLLRVEKGSQRTYLEELNDKWGLALKLKKSQPSPAVPAKVEVVVVGSRGNGGLKARAKNFDLVEQRSSTTGNSTLRLGGRSYEHRFDADTGLEEAYENFGDGQRIVHARSREDPAGKFTIERFEPTTGTLLYRRAHTPEPGKAPLIDEVDRMIGAKRKEINDWLDIAFEKVIAAE
jgi:hypothetical protein